MEKKKTEVWERVALGKGSPGEAAWLQQQSVQDLVHLKDLLYS